MKRDATTRMLRVLTIGLISLLFIDSAEAQPLDVWGVQVGTSVSDCPSFCTNVNFGPTAGGQGFASASSSISETRGNADSFGVLSASLGTPVLKARGTANPSQKGAGGAVFATQGYTYNGPATTLTLDVTLTGTLEDPAATSRGDIDARVMLFAADGFEFISDVGTILFESGAMRLTSSDGISPAEVEITLEDTGSINQTESISINVIDGDQFYIWSFLDADAVSSSTEQGLADAFNTLTMSFTNSTGLTPAVSIPEPSAAVLLFAACVCAVSRRRL